MSLAELSVDRADIVAAPSMVIRGPRPPAASAWPRCGGSGIVAADGCPPAAPRTWPASNRWSGKTGPAAEPLSTSGKKALDVPVASCLSRRTSHSPLP